MCNKNKLKNVYCKSVSFLNYVLIEKNEFSLKSGMSLGIQCTLMIFKMLSVKEAGWKPFYGPPPKSQEFLPVKLRASANANIFSLLKEDIWNESVYTP